MKHVFILFGIFSFGLANASGRDVVVSAAVSLRDLFTELKLEFEKENSEYNLRFNFAGSGTLRSQIEAGAPVDLFVSASQKDVEILGREGFVVGSTPKIVGSNALVLVAKKESSLILFNLKSLAEVKFEKMAIGNPLTVPAGRYAKESLESFDLYPKIESRLVFSEHVRQAVDYLRRGEVELAIVYKTDALKFSKDLKIIFEIPSSYHKRIEYPMALVKGSRRQKFYSLWTTFLEMKKTKEIIKKHGLGS